MKKKIRIFANDQSTDTSLYMFYNMIHVLNSMLSFKTILDQIYWKNKYPTIITNARLIMFCLITLKAKMSVKSLLTVW